MSAPSGAWIVTGIHTTRSPSSSTPYTATYSLSRPSTTGVLQKDSFDVTLTFSAHTASYTFTGRVSLSRSDALMSDFPYPAGAYSQWAPTAHGSSFTIYGSGTIVPTAELPGTEGYECFYMPFAIGNAGNGPFAGIVAGGGWIRVRVPKEGETYWPNTGESVADVVNRRSATGACKFEGVSGGEGGGLM
ncbi:MAG: hypothetical protein L6R40_002360 [Gallowayella cf. fulva]|nr:MAG: hypothetical protein L6R40_002360 [Xanthomendoza cf. fulva]